MGERNPAHSPWGQQDQSHSATAWSGKPRIQEYRMRPAKTGQRAGLGPVTGPEIAHGRRQSLPPAPEPVVRVLLASAHSANCCSGPGAGGSGVSGHNRWRRRPVSTPISRRGIKRSSNTMILYRKVGTQMTGPPRSRFRSEVVTTCRAESHIQPGRSPTSAAIRWWNSE